jgi:hypothetical protein
MMELMVRIWALQKLPIMEIKIIMNWFEMILLMMHTSTVSNLLRKNCMYVLHNGINCTTLQTFPSGLFVFKLWYPFWVEIRLYMHFIVIWTKKYPKSILVSLTVRLPWIKRVQRSNTVVMKLREGIFSKDGGCR